MRPCGHEAPLFTITVVASENGKGTRIDDRDTRRRVRYVVGRVCEQCLSRTVVKVHGRKLSLPLRLGLEVAGNRT